MGVLVCYDDFTYDVINDYHLDYLLDKGCVLGYDSSGNWVKSENNSQDARLLPVQRTRSPRASNSKKST